MCERVVYSSGQQGVEKQGRYLPIPTTYLPCKPAASLCAWCALPCGMHPRIPKKAVCVCVPHSAKNNTPTAPAFTSHHHLFTHQPYPLYALRLCNVTKPAEVAQDLVEAW